MNLKKILSEDVITLNLEGNTKNEIIESLVDLLVNAGKITDRKAAIECIMEREKKMSTGIQHGIAIPHGKSGSVKDLAACIGIKKEGINFDALDGEKSRIFITTISPTNKTGPHVQFLSEVSQLLKHAEKRELLIKAESAKEILALFIGKKT